MRNFIGTARSRMRKLPFAKLVKDEKGVTAIEFAILSPVFFGMLFSAVELGLLMLKIALLDTAATEISRSIYTGAATNGVVTKAQLKEQACETLSFLDGNCTANLAIELTPITSLTAIPAVDATCVDSNNVINPVVAFNPGVSSQTVYMRLCLTTAVYVPGIGLGLNYSTNDNGNIQIVSALAFANEPF